MEKYSILSAITSKYLHGKLCKLTMEYEDSDTIEVSVTYEYANFYELDYKMLINLKKENISFISHNNEIGINKFKLDREEAFESAVSKTILHPST